MADHASDSVARGPILLIGGSGMLGRAWRELLDRQGLPYDAPTRNQLDLLNHESIDRAVADRYRLVVNCAAWTDVDGAEADETAAAALNTIAPGWIAEACARTGAMLVHYSTDYVFDGEGTEPYPIDAPTNPKTAYGRTKAAGEMMIRASGAAHLIARTSWLFAPWGSNFVLTMMRLLAERDEVNVVRDQRGRPTACDALADATWRLVQAGAHGVHHVCNAGDCTWFDLAQRIRLDGGARARVAACTTSAFPRPAPRPAYSVLDLSETERLIGPLEDWHAALDRTIDAVLAARDTRRAA